MATYVLTPGTAGLMYQARQTEDGTSVFLKNSVIAYILTSSACTQVSDGDYPAATTWGVVYLDDYIFVQATDGYIYNCDAGGAYSSWNPLNRIKPSKEPSLSIGIAKSGNFLVAFKQWDTEFFYDAGREAPGSPLAANDGAYMKLGCATAESIAEFDGGICFMSKRDQNQRSREIHVLNLTQPQKISTPEVERILNADDLATCYALYLSCAGHNLYVLTLKTSAITLVYDFDASRLAGKPMWYQWSFLTAQAAQNVTNGNLTNAVGTATLVLTAHGFNDGDPVTIAGANEAGYNGIHNVTYVDANTVTFPVAAATSSPATGTVTATGYNESYFPAVSYTNYQNVDLVLHESNGIVYSLDPTTYQDNGVPINVLCRLSNWTAGTSQKKSIREARIVGDINSTTALLRYNDKDYDSSSWSKYRRQDMSVEYSYIRRIGMSRRRAYEFRHTDNTAFRAEAVEQELE